MKLLISACLLGIACRYDGKSKEYPEIKELYDKCELIPFCPECYGGLSTPRSPCEIKNDRVISQNGAECTQQYVKGAHEALALCKKLDIKCALLKEKSPSCGKGLIYDGTFSKTLVTGDGVTAKLLSENSIRVFGESELQMLLEYIKGVDCK